MSGTVRQLRQPVDARSAAARLVWIALPGPKVDDETAELVQRGAGGVVLFSRNLTGVEQVAHLTAELRRLAPRPLHIAIDHEGGHVARMGAPLTRFPSAMAVAATRSEELARAVARAAGAELRALGIDVNLAPVLDVALDPRNASVGARSFGSAPEAVARFGAATVRGYHEAGLAATAKHFPGHGRTPVDSHLALPIVAGGLEALREHDLPPFQRAIEAGVELVMVSHVAYDGLTGELPSTLSGAIMRDLLRDELGFGGVVVTDAMVMRALADRLPIPEACVAAVAAGADVVMPLDRQPEVMTALEEAIDGGRLDGHSVSRSLARIDRLAPRLGGRAGQASVELPVPAHAELARQVARESLTLLRGADLLPIRAGTAVAVIEFASRRPSPVEEGPLGTATLGAALRRHLPRTRQVIIEGASDIAAGELAAAAAVEDAELVLLATRDAYLWPEEQKLIARLISAGRRTILVALRNPHDLAALPGTGAAIAAYADVPATLDALADALTGRAGWPGSLPMELRP